MKEYWKTAAGQVLSVDDMAEAHAKNCLKVMIRRETGNSTNAAADVDSMSEEGVKLFLSKMIQDHNVKNADPVGIPYDHTEIVNALVQAHYSDFPVLSPEQEINTIWDVENFSTDPNNWKKKGLYGKEVRDLDDDWEKKGLHGKTRRGLGGK